MDALILVLPVSESLTTRTSVHLISSICQNRCRTYESEFDTRPQLNQHGFFVDLLRLYAPDRQTLIELLGFKYKYYMSR